MLKLRPSHTASSMLISVVAGVVGIAWLVTQQPAAPDIADTEDAITSKAESSGSVVLLASGSTRAPGEDESNMSPASEERDDARAGEEHQPRPRSNSRRSAEEGPKARLRSEGDFSFDNSHAEVGQPFPVSRSMRSQCKRNPVPSAESCARVSKLLDEMAQEPRDESWALDVEAKLRGHVLREHPTARIRALECRTSLCAIEVASETGHLVILGEEDQRNCGIYDLANDSGSYETAPSGSKVTVTLRVFERR